jgi:transposase-like protein
MHFSRHLTGWRIHDAHSDKMIQIAYRSRFARGMTVREIQGHLEELYGLAVSPDLISRVTDAVIAEVREWQNRPAAGLRLSPSIRTAWRTCL